MDTRLLKRTCESLLDASQDLVKEENATESLRKTRLYAMQIIDLLEEKEESFIDMLFKINHDVVSSLDVMIRWVNILVRTTWYVGDNYTVIKISCEKTYNNIFVPVLTHLGFSSEVLNKELFVRIMSLPDAKVDTVAYKYIKHQYGDYELIRIRRSMYNAFFDRRVDTYIAFYGRGIPNVKDMTEKEQQDYLSNLKGVLLRDLGLVLNIETHECTPHETHAKMLMDHLL